MKVGFRGSRGGMTEGQKIALRQVLAEYRPDEFHHGDFVGADAEAHGIVKALYPATQVVIHPPTNQTLRAFCKGDEQRPARGLPHPLGLGCVDGSSTKPDRSGQLYSD